MSAKMGHFGSLVIGEEQAADEAARISISAHHFGPAVVDYDQLENKAKPSIFGSAVTDETQEEQIQKSLPMPPHDPQALAELSAKEARPVINEEQSIRILLAWKRAELAHPKFDGGRAAVLRYLNVRIGELTTEAPEPAAAENTPEEPAEESEADEAEED